MPEQVRQALDDGETEAKAAAALAGGIVELMELLEDRSEAGSSGMPMPVSQTSMRSLSPRRRQPSRTLPLRGVFHRVRQQVADHLLEQAGSLRTVRPLATTRQSRPCASA